MKQSNLKNKPQIGRFAVVGIANTAIDFILLFTLKVLGLPTISANLISSTTAFVFSFAANKNYTFKSVGGDIPRQIILFIIITLTGLWLFQSVVIHLSEDLFTEVFRNDELGLLVSKILATVVSMVWNYVMYASIVFKHPTDKTK